MRHAANGSARGVCSKPLKNFLINRVADRHAVAVGAVDFLVAEDVGLDYLAGNIHGHAVAVGQAGLWP